jgi:uncharacterized protein
LVDVVDIENLIQNDAWMMDVLGAVQRLHLPDWMVGAGFIRSKVWDHLHGYQHRTPLPDIDVIYFDPRATDPAAENTYELQLCNRLALPWSVKNQARMDLRNRDAPYVSSADALARWPETATCVAATLSNDGSVRIIAPHGITDLVELRVQPNSLFSQDLEIYRQRVAARGWHGIWPLLQISDAACGNAKSNP